MQDKAFDNQSSQTFSESSLPLPYPIPLHDIKHVQRDSFFRDRYKTLVYLHLERGFD